MVMFSAHIEYGVREKHRPLFSQYHSIQANWDPNKQIQDIRTLLDQGIDLLLIDALDDRIVAQGVEEASKSHVPVILVGSSFPSSYYLTRLNLASEEQGRLSIRRLVDTVGWRDLVILSSPGGTDSGSDWLRGVRSHYPGQASLPVDGFLNSDWSVKGAFLAMSEWLAAGRVVRGVAVSNGFLARGAAEAFLERGMDVPPIAGADDWNGWLRLAKQHSIPFWGCTGGANLGLHCVDLATHVLSGQPVATVQTLGYQVFDTGTLHQYFRPDLSDSYWGEHELPEVWIERMFRL